MRRHYESGSFKVLQRGVISSTKQGRTKGGLSEAHIRALIRTGLAVIRGIDGLYAKYT